MTPSPIERIVLPDSSTVGERAFAGTLFSEYGPELRRSIEWRVNPPLDVDDILQDVMLRAMTKNWTMKNEKGLPPFPFLLRLVIDVIIEQRRRLRPNEAIPEFSGEHFAMGLAASLTTPSQRLQGEEEQSQLGQAILKLKDRERQALQFRHLDEISSADAAEIMGIEIENFYQIYSRARKRLWELCHDNT